MLIGDAATLISNVTTLTADDIGDVAKLTPTVGHVSDATAPTFSRVSDLATLSADDAGSATMVTTDNLAMLLW